MISILFRFKPLLWHVWVDKHWVLEVPDGIPHLIVVLHLYIVCNIEQLY